MQVRAGRATGRADETDHVAGVYRLAHGNVNLREVTISRGQAAAVIYVNHVSIATLPTGNGHFACRGDFNGSPPCRIDVLSFVILVSAAGEWIASTTDTTLESSENRPNRRHHAARAQERFVHSHLTLELFSLCFQGCE